MASTSIHLASPFSKKVFLRRTMILRLKRSTKTAPKDVFVKCFLMFLLFKNLVKTLSTKSVHLSFSIKFVLVLDNLKLFSKEFYYCFSSFVFKRTVRPKLIKFFYHNQNLSITCNFFWTIIVYI